MSEAPGTSNEAASPTDPFLWLEDVLGERALAWVREQNTRSEAELTARPEYEPTRRAVLDVMNAKERIPYVAGRGPWFYNLWQDETHKRGLWRRKDSGRDVNGTHAKQRRSSTMP